MSDSAASSPAMRSQISICDEDEIHMQQDSRGQEHSPLSQAQFQTQIPFSDGISDTTGLMLLRPDSIRHGLGNFPAQNNPFSVNKQLSAALTDKASGNNPADRIEPLLENLRTSQGTSHEPSTHPDSSYEQRIEQEELPQAALIVATAREALAATTLIENQRNESTQSTYNEKGFPPPVMPVMPAAMLELMRNFRRESQNGRYLPRCIQTIPRAQEDLLIADESWQPPLVGKLQQPGTVPLDLLNKLTARADEQSKESMSTAVGKSDKEETTGIISPRMSERSADSAEESDPEDVWSPSPVRPPPIPPDSSPFKAVDHRDHGSIETPSKRDFETQAEVPGQGRDLAMSEREAQHPEASPTTATLDGIIRPREPHSFNQNSDMSKLSQPSDRSDRQSNYAAPSGRRKKSSGVSHKSVQVHRTPYGPKLRSSSGSFPDSTAIVVHGTFDDGVVAPQNQYLGKMVHNQDDPMSADDVHSFEIDSSEDQGLSRADMSEKDTYSSRSGQRFDTRLPSSALITNSSPIDPTILAKQDNPKRNPSKTENIAQQSQKRRRTLPLETTPAEHEDKSFSSLDQWRRKYRRDFYQSLRKSRTKTDRASLPAGNNVMEASPILAMSSPGYTATPEHPIHKHQHTKPLEDTIPTLRSSRSKNEADKPTAVSPNLSSVSKDPLVEFYLKFKTTYSEYGGDQKHFVAACQLLNKLYLKGKATHPSLWDDFVFRHHHDYRDHLMSVMENCGSALPYEEFYDTCVEVPTKLKRVIKPMHLDNWPLFSSSILSASAISNNVTSEPVKRDQSRTMEMHPNGMEGITTTVNEDTDMKDLAESQTSSQSVHAWLERAAGAESPELGTPRIEYQAKGDVSPISLRTVNSPVFLPLGDGPLTSKQVPQSSSAAGIDRVQSNAKLSRQAELSNPVVSSASVRASGSTTIEKQHHQGTTQRISTGRLTLVASPSARTATSRPSPRVREPSRPASFQSSIAKSASKSDGLSPTVQDKVMRPPPPQRFESKRVADSYPNQEHETNTPFKHFVRQYSELASEKRLKLDPKDANRFIEIFSWRYD